MSRDAPPYDPKNVSGRIADHAYEHVAEGRFQKERYGPPLNIEDKKQFQAHIERSILDAQTRCFKANDGRELFYHGATNTTVIVNPNRDAKGEQYGGTCYRSKNFEAEWQRLKNRETAIREEKNVREPLREATGGFDAPRKQEQDKAAYEVRRATYMKRAKHQREQTKKEHPTEG